MTRPARTECNLCKETIAVGTRSAHLKEAHPEAKGGIRANFSFPKK